MEQPSLIISACRAGMAMLCLLVSVQAWCALDLDPAKTEYDSQALLPQTKVSLLGGWRDNASCPVAGWRPIRGIDLGFQDHPVWLQLQLNNRFNQPMTRILDVDYPVLDEVRLYECRHGRLTYMGHSGDHVAPEERLLSQRSLDFRLTIPEHAQTIWYLKVQTTSSVVLPLRLYTEQSFMAHQTSDAWRKGLLYGAMLVLLMVNLLLWAFSRDSIFLWYVINQVPVLGYLLCADGLFYHWWPYPPIQDISALLWVALSNLLAPLFAASYLNLRHKSLSQRYLKANVVFAALALTPVWVGNLRMAAQLVMAMAILNMLLFPVIAYWRYRQGERAAFFYMVGWAAFFMVGGWSVLALEGWMPYRGYLVDDIKLALLATGLLLTLGVGVRLRELQRKQQDTAREVLRAEAQNSAKSEFLATMSHEIRTPMSGVLGMIDLLRVSGLSQEQQRIVSTIATSGEGLLTVINDILDYSRVESGRMSLDIQEFDLLRMLVESLALFKVRSYRKGLRILGSVSARTPVRVLGDSVRLRQILINLLANAVKYTDRGRIDLMVTSRRTSQGVRLEFAVKDTGCGIPDASLEHIFDSFQQGDRPQKHEGSSGLGLAICRRLCQLMGGDISVESHLHQGTTFSFWVELGVPILPTPPVDWPAGLACRLLLVDSDLEYLELMSREAALPDLIIETAMSGAECLSMLVQAEAEGKPFGLVVTELQLVDMNGLSLRQRMAELQLTQLTELIVMTQPYWQPNPGLLHQAGVAGAMERPIMGHEFRQSLANILLRDQVLPEGPPSTLVSHRPLRILVAEDNPTNQMVLVGMLRRLGMEPEVVADGEQACSRFQSAQHAFDLILMDCEMPVCDGFEAARRIRAMEQQQGKSRTPMLAVTAHVTRPHILACYEAGMDDHLPKPISPADLRTKLEHWVVL